MKQNIEFEKTIFSKRQYEKNINISFTELDTLSLQEQIDETPSIIDFFQMYNELFYDIPQLGNINSHEFLIKKSTQYIGFDQNNEEIEALQNEISQLRIELLESQKQLQDLQSTTPINN